MGFRSFQVKMTRQVLSVCVFCFICATHSPCASHAAVSHETPRLRDMYDLNNAPLVLNATREKVKNKSEALQQLNNADQTVHVNKRSSDSDNSNIYNRDVFIQKIFQKYGNGETMSIEGFEKLLSRLGDVKVLSEKLGDDADVGHLAAVDQPAANSNKTYFSNLCVNEGMKPLLQPPSNSSQQIDRAAFEEACPAILFSIITDNCTRTAVHVHDPPEKCNGSCILVWVYSISAVVLISACGVFSLVIIPVMQKKFYKPLLQFFVALAVGTLAGDALLHLLPHAMSSHHGDHDHENHENMWKGFVAMLGLILFFIMERFIPLIYKWGKGKRGKHQSHVKVLNSGLAVNKADDTQCMDKYNAYPRCYRDILNDPNTKFLDPNETVAANRLLGHRKGGAGAIGDNPRSAAFESEQEEYANKKGLEESSLEANRDVAECLSPLNDHHENHHGGDYTVILTHHAAVHHGHSHTHGHVHAAPQNLSAVAWMVIMGDGLHNFTDGMAIGAAFSGSIAGGFSTSVAVFCHELPHELGDFAMLLKAGMSIKEALFYNVLSSILCLFGNLFGLWLGNTEHASSWVFAVAAGTFIYIALVDMIPELSSAHEDEGNVVQSMLHLSGLILGFGIMTLIALFEHDLKNIFHD